MVVWFSLPGGLSATTMEPRVSMCFLLHTLSPYRTTGDLPVRPIYTVYTHYMVYPPLDPSSAFQAEVKWFNCYLSFSV